MRVTVAICTWNRCELLRQTLEQLTRAIVPDAVSLEVIVVNNNSTDATDAVIEDFNRRLPIRRVFEPQPGLSHARNAALTAAGGEYVAFTDDDVLVHETWLVEFESASRAFPEAAAIGGIIEPWFPHPPDPDLMEVFGSLRRGFCALDHEREAGPLPDELSLWGANMAYRASAIGPLRFDPDLGPSPTSTVCADETDFIRRLRSNGGVVLWWPNMRVRHYVLPSRMTLEYLLSHTAGKGAEEVLMGRAQSTPSVLGAPRWAWWALARTYFQYARFKLDASDRRTPPMSLSGSISPLASRRVRALCWRRELAFLRGMVNGYRAQRNRSTSCRRS